MPEENIKRALAGILRMELERRFLETLCLSQAVKRLTNDDMIEIAKLHSATMMEAIEIKKTDR